MSSLGNIAPATSPGPAGEHVFGGVAFQAEAGEPGAAAWGRPRGMALPRPAEWAFYGFMACYLYIVPRFPPLPTSPLTLATLLALLLFGPGLPISLSAYRGRARLCLVLITVYFLYALAVDFAATGGFHEGGLLFLAGFLCLAGVAGRTRRREGAAGVRRLLVVYTVLLVFSMLWFLATYFSDRLFVIHARYYSYTEQDLGYRWCSGLSLRPHLFAYQLIPLTIILLAAHAAGRGWKRAFFLALLALAGLTIVLYGERSVVPALAAGVAFLLPIRELRGGILRAALVVAVAVGAVVARQEFQAWQKSEMQAGLISRLTNKQLQTEMESRLKLQQLGLKTLWRYPEGVLLSGHSWEAVASRQDVAVFDAWGRGVIGVHNGYLSAGDTYGLPAAVLILLALWVLFSISARAVAAHPRQEPRDLTAPVLAAATVGDLVQALFHNASFASSESSTLILLVLLLASISAPGSRSGASRPQLPKPADEVGIDGTPGDSDASSGNWGSDMPVAGEK